MSYFFWNSARWFQSALCCRYVAVQFAKLRVPMFTGGALTTADWNWALGLCTSGEFESLGGWRDEGPATPQRIASDLHARGLERITALAADDSLIAAMRGLGPKVCEHAVAELASPGAASSRMRKAIRWTDTAMQHLQGRMSRAVKKQGPFADHAAAADFLAQAFQRADRDLLADYWERPKPAPYGPSAAPRVLARAA